MTPEDVAEARRRALKQMQQPPGGWDMDSPEWGMDLTEAAAPVESYDEPEAMVVEGTRPVDPLEGVPEFEASFPAREPDTFSPEYARAQQVDNDAFLINAVGKLGAGINEKLTGVKYDRADYDLKRLPGQADKLLERRKAEWMAEERARKGRLADPTSPESKAFQASVAKVLPGVYDEATLATLTPDMKGIIFDRAKVMEETKRRAHERGSDRTNKLTDEESRRTYEQERDGRQAAAAMDRTREHARIMAGAKDADQTRQSTVTGYESAPDAKPTPQDAEAVKKSLAAAKKIREYVGKMRALYKKHGAQMTGSVADDFNRQRTAIKLEAKTIGELGALSGPDSGLIDSLQGAADPTTLKAKAGDVAEAVTGSRLGIADINQAFDGIDDWANTTLEATAEARGYKPRGAPGPAGAWTPEKQKRLEQLRAKKAAGNLQ